MAGSWHVMLFMGLFVALAVLASPVFAAAPVAAFSATPTTGTFPLTVAFTDASENSPAGWAWDFDNDGIVDSTEQNPAFIFISAGTFTVTLTATNADGSDDETKAGYITVNHPNRFTNPDFETGDLSGWTAGSKAFIHTTRHGGEYGIHFDYTGNADTCYLQQSADLSNVESISFWGYQEGGSTKQISMYIDDQLVQSSAGVPNTWTQYAIPTDYTGIHAVTIKWPGGYGFDVDDFSANILDFYADFTATPTVGLVPLTVTFTDASLGSITRYAWDFDNDGTTDSTEQNPSWTYTAPGMYTVKLAVSNAGNSDEMVKTDYIAAFAQEPPVAQFTADPVSGVEPLDIQFTDQSENYVTEWAWDFDNDGTVDSTGQDPAWTYGKAGTYTVRLTVTGPLGTDDEVKTDYIAVNYAVPAAGFSATPTSGAAPLTVQFTDTTIGTVTSYGWDFENDGTVDSTEKDPAWTYSTAGTYTVRLTVTGPGGSDDEIKSNCISVLDPGVVWTAKSEWNLADIGDYTEPRFADLDGDGDLDLLVGQKTGISYGYENTGTAASPVWTAKPDWDAPSVGTYADPYFADLDGDGDSDLLIGAYDGITYGYENTGTASSPAWTARSDWNLPDLGTKACPALADLDGDGDIDLLVGINGGIALGYENTGTTGSPAWTAKSEWNAPDVGSYAMPAFADLDRDGDADLLVGSNDGISYGYKNTGTTGPVWTAMPVWNAADIGTYATPALADLDLDGDYDLLIGARDGISYGYENTGSQPPLSAPVVDFTAIPTSGYAPETVRFIDKSVNQPTSWIWDFGDGTISTLRHPVHEYTATGTFTVMLTATNSLGSDTKTKEGYITIEAPTAPVAGFTATPASGNAPLDVRFTDTSTGTITRYEWDFNNDGTVDSTEKNPLHTYTGSGVFTVNHTVSGYGLSSSSVQADLITVSGSSDLSVTLSSTLRAYYQNTVTATVTNTGSDAAACMVRFRIDGNATTADVASVPGYGSTTVSIADPVWGRKYGQTVPVTITVDPENTIAESNETNNEYSGSATVQTNGDSWVGGRYYSGIDLEPTVSAEGHVGVAISNGGTGYYGGNPTYTAEELGIPATATIKAAHLNLAWTWYGYTPYTVSFNGNSIATPLAHYEDGNDGQDVYDVTAYFVPGATNTATIGGGCSASYGRTLVVIYEDESLPYRQIWLDEGYDILYHSPAIGYAMFYNTDAAKAGSAELITVIPSGGGEDTGSVQFNGQTVARASMGGSDPSFNYYDVRNVLQDGTNEAGISGASYMAISTVVLSVTQKQVPVAEFTADLTTGTVPLTVVFTDTSSGPATSWAWDFDNDGTIDSTEQNPSYTYTAAGTYPVTLTATNDLGSDSETKADYITVTAATGAPVAAFSATPATGTFPLTVAFTDESTDSPTGWAWDFNNDGTTDSTEQNPSYTYDSSGSYTVTLTATNEKGSDSETKTGYITVNTISASSLPLTTEQTGTVSGDLYVGSFQPVPFADQPTSATVRDFDQAFAIPSFTDVQWAKAYVNVYSGSGSANWPARTTISLDGNGDGSYESTLGVENMDTESYSADGTVFWLNNHMNRVYSDYETEYDVTGLITSATPAVHVKVEKTGANFDGRLKAVTLVVAYNDGDSDQVKYWVNHGHDWINSGSSSTTFSTSGLATGFTEATLSNVGLSSYDAGYTFNSVTKAGADPVAPIKYYESHTWSVTDALTAGSDSMFAYSLTSGSFKTTLATLAVRYPATTPSAPVADFSAVPTSGVAPLTVGFTDASTNTPTSWAWDFDNDGTTDTTEQNPSHTYTIAGTYTVRLTATNAAGSDDEVRTDYITVREAAAASMTVAKSASVSALPETGGEVTYTYLLKNTGSLVISGVTLTDDQLGAIAGPVSGDTDADNILDAGETWTYSAAATLTETTTNTATASGSDPAGSPVSATSNAVTVTVGDEEPIATPEFPTVAFPVMVVLALALLAMDYRKE